MCSSASLAFDTDECEADAGTFFRIDGWLVEQADGQRFKRLDDNDDAYGGHKALQASIWCGAFNHLDVHGFIDFLRTLDFAGWAQVVHQGDSTRGSVWCRSNTPIRSTTNRRRSALIAATTTCRTSCDAVTGAEPSRRSSCGGRSTDLRVSSQSGGGSRGSIATPEDRAASTGQERQRVCVRTMPEATSST